MGEFVYIHDLHVFSVVLLVLVKCMLYIQVQFDKLLTTYYHYDLFSSQFATMPKLKHHHHTTHISVYLPLDHMKSTNRPSSTNFQIQNQHSSMQSLQFLVILPVVDGYVPVKL